MSQPSKEPQALSQLIRQLRLAAGLTGAALANAVNMSQSKISKIETGRLTPSRDDVIAILAAVKATDDVRAAALELLSAASEIRKAETIVRQSRSRVRESQLHEMERSAREVRVFVAALVPALLQTAEYAREVICRAEPNGNGRVAKQVTARLERQTLLYTETRKFTFVMLETALHHRYLTSKAMLAQLDRLETLMDLESVELGLIALEALLPFVAHNGFVIYDDSRVTVETMTRHHILDDADDVAEYRRVFDEAFAIAETGPEAHRAIRGFADSLTAT